MSLLRSLDVEAISRAARKESRNREVGLPPVSVYRWWARRTLAVNDAILADQQPGLLVDPFAGGGVIPLTGMRRGWKVYAQDINPWAVHGLNAVLDLWDPQALTEAAADLSPYAESLSQEAYGTVFSDGEPAQVAHTFRVATAACPGCGERLRLFPHAMISAVRRKDRGGDPTAFVTCRRGHLFRGAWDGPQWCQRCSVEVDPRANYLRGRSVRCGCGHVGSVSDLGTLLWEVVLVERAGGGRRELALPTDEERRRAAHPWPTSATLGEIPEGRETRVLLRHGFRNWGDLYPRRQRYVLESLLARTTGPLRMAVVGSAEMAGLCSRWDRWYLKAFETMAGHRFNFTTLTVEPNVWGTREAGRGTVRRRIRSFEKASRWMSQHAAGAVQVQLGSSESLKLEAEVADLILTDPPYHDDVEYGELSMPLRAWAGLSMLGLEGEAVAGAGRDYSAVMGRIFAECRRVLKPSGHLVFSYANRDPEAWVALFGALQEAGYWASGCVAVHSENETDGSKRGVKSCTMDLLLDLTRSPGNGGFVDVPDGSDEGAFLRVVAETFSKIGGLREGWETRLRAALRSTRFLS